MVAQMTFTTQFTRYVPAPHQHLEFLGIPVHPAKGKMELDYLRCPRQQRKETEKGLRLTTTKQENILSKRTAYV